MEVLICDVCGTSQNVARSYILTNDMFDTAMYINPREICTNCRRKVNEEYVELLKKYHLWERK